jgi:hypothetical protein
MSIIMLHEQIDFFCELLDAPKRSPANRLLGDYPELCFDLTEPGEVGRVEIKMILGFLGKPGTNLLVLMGRIVVHNNVNIQFRQYIRVNMAEKLQKLLMSMPLLGLGHNPSCGDIQGSE